MGRLACLDIGCSGVGQNVLMRAIKDMMTARISKGRGKMVEIIIKGEPKEIAALVVELQKRRNVVLAEEIKNYLQDQTESNQFFL